MENIDTYLRKIFAAGVGAADIGYEKLGVFVDECIKRGEVTVEKGRALNEELKHRCKDAMSQDSERNASIDLEKLSDSERAELLEKLLAMKENNK
ncbi:MAG: aspartyl beta-hydroxylase [Clostridia bacterium]|nr:aspartyl beta-hydroxylase [Clostridia bacterium]